jgi:glycosyltransferase involved in cell wall biosynthesis
MKILNIMLSKDLGGIQQSFLDYSTMLKLEKINVVNISSLGAEINNMIKPDYKLLNLGNWDFSSMMRLKSIIAKEQPDAVIAHGGRATKFALKARPENLPIVGIIHSDKLKWVDKCDHIIVLNDAMKKKSIEAGIETSRLTKLPNAIDLASCSAIKTKDETPGPPIIGTMSRFVPKKGIDVFLESLSLLKKEGVQFKAIIGGGGDDEQNLKSLSNKLGLTHYVEFIGWVKDKKEFFNKLDIFCLPSLNEPFGIILLEAMAYKTPVISTKTAGPIEILKDNFDGLLVDKGSAEQMAESMKLLLDDEILSSKLADNALLTVGQNYDTSVVSKKLSKLLNNIIKKS